MSDRRRPRAFWALIAILAAEFLLVAILSIVLVVETLVAAAQSTATAVALVVLALLATAWLGAVVIGMLRGQAWTRGSAIVWQVLQFAVGAGAISGVIPQPGWGWPLVVAAFVAFALLFSKPVVEATSQRDSSTIV